MVENTSCSEIEPRKQMKVKLPLFLYDVLIFVLTDLFLLVLYRSGKNLSLSGMLQQSLTAFVCIFGSRYVAQIYRQIWRYGGIQCYIRLLLADSVAFVLYFALTRVLPVVQIAFVQQLNFTCMNLLAVLVVRMVYRYAYKCGYQDNWKGKVLRLILKVFSGGRVVTEADPDRQKIKIAIIGAGTVGVSLAEDLWTNPKAKYVPRCFIDSDPEKIGRTIHGVAAMSEDEAKLEKLRSHHIQEVVFAVPSMPRIQKMELYGRYQQAGFKTKVFDFQMMEIPGRKRQLRDFNIEDLLMREQKELLDDHTRAYYKDKVILITGGGGSIGSELCR